MKSSEDNLWAILMRASSCGRRAFLSGVAALAAGMLPARSVQGRQAAQPPRTRTLLDQDWRFIKGDPPGTTPGLLYDVRPPVQARGAAPVAAPTPDPAQPVIKSWVVPSGNSFVKDPAKRANRPSGNPGDGVSYIAATFDD